jgi:hypothetical protein
LFRRMAGFTIRHFVNDLQVAYQSTGPRLPLLYASYSSLKDWLREDLRVDSADDLLELYIAETVAFWRRFQRLFERVFPRQWEILRTTLALAWNQCAVFRKVGRSLSASDIATFYAHCLAEAKLDAGYLNDREECRARFEELVAEVNASYRTTRMTREQALYHLLPRPPRKPRKM